MATKRRAEDEGAAAATAGGADAAEDGAGSADAPAPAKRARVEVSAGGAAGGGGGRTSTALVTSTASKGGALIVAEEPRTSGLMAPIMLLTGHGGAVNGLEFSPSGEFVASASSDKTVLLWHVYGGCANYETLSGHRNAVLDCAWSSDSDHVFSAGADKFALCFDASTGQRVRKFAGHRGLVNSVSTTVRGQTLAVTSSDDGTVRLWDPRYKLAAQTFEGRFPITDAVFAAAGDRIFSAGVDNDIHAWDRRTGEVVLTLKGHSDTVTGLAVSPDGNTLLSNGMDRTVRAWDVRPFCAGDRLTRTFVGALHNLDRSLHRVAWSHDGERVGAGSSDGMSYVWNYETTKLEYRLPGHKGAVNDVAFHPKEPIFGSCGNDKQIFLGELAKML